MLRQGDESKNAKYELTWTLKKIGNFGAFEASFMD